MKIQFYLFLLALALFVGLQTTAYAQSTEESPNLMHFRLKADKTVLKGGETTTITIQHFDDMISSLVEKESDDYKWGILHKSQYTTIKWQVASGPGKVIANALDPAKVTYTAPAGANSATVQVSAIISGLREEEEAKSKMTSQLTIPITIVKDQYVTFTVDGKTYTVNGDCESGCIHHKPSDRFHFKVSMGGAKELVVLADQYKEGSYTFGSEEVKKNVGGVIWKSGLKQVDGQVVEGNKTYTASYSESTENCARCKTVYSIGGVTITKIEEAGQVIQLTKAEEAAVMKGTASKAIYEKMAQQIGHLKTTYAEGTFHATLYYGGEKGDSKSISGKFRVKAW